MDHHKHIIGQWDELLAMIAAAKTTTENADAHTCLNAIKNMAEEHSKLIAAKQAEKK